MNREERNKLVIYRIKKARITFEEIQVLIDNQFWNTAVNRL